MVLALVGLVVAVLVVLVLVLVVLVLVRLVVVRFEGVGGGCRKTSATSSAKSKGGTGGSGTAAAPSTTGGRVVVGGKPAHQKCPSWFQGTKVLLGKRDKLIRLYDMKRGCKSKTKVENFNEHVCKDGNE